MFCGVLAVCLVIRLHGFFETAILRVLILFLSFSVSVHLFAGFADMNISWDRCDVLTVWFFVKF